MTGDYVVCFEIYMCSNVHLRKNLCITNYNNIHITYNIMINRSNNTLCVQGQRFFGGTLLVGNQRISNLTHCFQFVFVIM